MIFKHRVLVILLLIIGLTVLVSFTVNTVFKSDTVHSQNSEAETPVSRFSVKIPLPFEEMTIPALRSRDYKSKLSNLNFYSEGEVYTSYLTSYESDGLTINGLLTRPKGDMPENGWPAIVFVHGYIPPSSYRTTSNYGSYVDYLARNGFVVFKIDLRGHGESEGEAGGGYFGADYVIDTLNARSALRETDFVDFSRIGFWGHSMAGNIIFRSAVAALDVPAVSIWAGAVYTYSDFQQYGIDDNSYRPPNQESPGRRRRNLLFETHGAFDPENEFWKQVVPTNYLEGVATSIQLNHSVNDEVVSIEYSRNLSKILEGSKMQVNLIEYPSGGHNINGSQFNVAMQNTVNFFKENL